MTIVRFYADVPKYKVYPQLFACTTPTIVPSVGTRVAFDVDLPPGLWIDADVQAPITTAKVISTLQPEPQMISLAQTAVNVL